MEVPAYDSPNNARRPKHHRAVLVFNLQKCLAAPRRGCGRAIEYDKAQPVRWEEQNCTACGRPLIRRMGEPSPYFVATGDYVPGAPLCRTCLEKYCTQTNCLQCELGSWPGCRYVSIKQHMMRKVSEQEGKGDSDV